MNDLVNYIFKHMDTTDRNFIILAKAIKKQGAGGIMNSIAILLTAGLLRSTIKENAIMKREIISLQKKIDELKESEGV